MKRIFLSLFACGILLAGGFVQTASASVSVNTLIEEAVWQELDAAAPEGALLSIRLLTPEPPTALGLEHFLFDPRNGRFRASVITEEGTLQQIGGVAVVEIEVPVPAQRLSAGHIIEESDLVKARLPAFQVGSMVVQDRAQLVGQQVLRTLAPSRPIQEQSVGAPIVTKRGAEVTIVLKNGPISISVPGRVLENGALGQRVRVINDVSSQTVHAHVVDGQTVEIRN